ncbi:MAG: D-alanine--D-alanine ligase [Clostridiales bacterium]|nr:D-alanine--D-alanine ligase [Clostridiales bacterium]
MSKLNVMVLFGGKSKEHEVSLMSATSVLNAMNSEKYNIITVGITKKGVWKRYNGSYGKIQAGEWEQLADEECRNLIGLLGNTTGGENEREIKAYEKTTEQTDNFKIDVVFPVLHGPYGEDGKIQGMLEMMGRPYVGAGVLASALAMDKAMVKKIFSAEKIPQTKYKVIENYKKLIADDVVGEIESKCSYPVFIKPANLGSSVGINKAKNKQELISAIELASKYDKKVLVEEFIDGREIECAVLGNENPIASLPAEIIPSREFYDYKDKYFEGKSKFIIPADIGDGLAKRVKDMALKVYKLIDCSGLARVDFFLERKTNRLLVNEINTMPGFTKISMYPKMWEASGISYEDLVDRLIQLAIEKHKE